MSNSGKLNSLMAQKATLESKQLNAEDATERAMVTTQLSGIKGRITAVRQQEAQDKIEAQNEKRMSENKKQSELRNKEEKELKTEVKKETKLKQARKKEKASDLKFVPQPEQAPNAAANTAFNKASGATKADYKSDKAEGSQIKTGKR